MGFFDKKSFVGLDLGHFSIKAIQIEKSGHSWKITRSGSIPTPPETIKDGVVVDTATLAEAIKSLLKACHISATTAHIAAAGGSVFVRPVPFPKMTETALRKSIKFEASRYVPGSVDDSFIEFEILGAIDETHMNVLIVAAPKDIVESRMEACRKAGLDVDSVDIEAFAMYRALIETDETLSQGEGTLAVVDVGAFSTNVSVVVNGIFAMNRTIPNGGATLTEALKAYFKLSDEDAETGKSQLNAADMIGEVGPKENPPLRVIQPHLDDLVREIRRSLNYFQSQQTDISAGKDIARIILAGGGAKMPGFGIFLEQKLGIPVSPVGVFHNPRFLPMAGDEDSGLDLAIATGLAMRGYAKAA